MDMYSVKGRTLRRFRGRAVPPSPTVYWGSKALESIGVYAFMFQKDMFFFDFFDFPLPPARIAFVCECFRAISRKLKR